MSKIFGYQPSFFFALSLISVNTIYLATSIPRYTLPAFFLYMGRQVRYPSTLSTTKQGDCYYSTVMWLCFHYFPFPQAPPGEGRGWIPTTNIERRRVCFSSAGSHVLRPTAARSQNFQIYVFDPVKYPPFRYSSRSRDGSARRDWRAVL